MHRVRQSGLTWELSFLLLESKLILLMTISRWVEICHLKIFAYLLMWFVLSFFSDKQFLAVKQRSPSPMGRGGLTISGAKYASEDCATLVHYTIAIVEYTRLCGPLKVLTPSIYLYLFYCILIKIIFNLKNQKYIVMYIHFNTEIHNTP